MADTVRESALPKAQRRGCEGLWHCARIMKIRCFDKVSLEPRMQEARPRAGKKKGTTALSAPVAAFSHDRRIAEALLEISYAVGSVMEVDDILQRICDIGAKVMETDTCSVYLIDEEESDMLVLRATHGLSRAEELGVRGFRVGEGVPGWAAQNNTTAVLDDASHDPRYARLDDTEEESRYTGYICTPLRIQDEVVGVMTWRRGGPAHWGEEEVVFGEIVAKQVVIVLEKARLYTQKVEAERLAAIAISLGEVAHYIKNLLNNMSGGEYFVELGLKRGDMEKVHSGWGILKRANAKIRTLVENMLAFSRGDSVELVEDDLNAVVAELAGDVEETAHQRGMTLSLALSVHNPTVRLDRTAITDAILNLVTNAMDAIPEDRTDGRVEIRTEHHAERHIMRVVVRDNGTGIPEHVQKRLFNLFFSTKGRGGTGIGLAVTRKIIEEHDGTIHYETSPEGTAFIIDLPTV